MEGLGDKYNSGIVDDVFFCGDIKGLGREVALVSPTEDDEIKWSCEQPLHCEDCQNLIESRRAKQMTVALERNVKVI